MLNERSDVYSFGILIMEVLTGRNPVDYSRPPEEVCLIHFSAVTLPVIPFFFHLFVTENSKFSGEFS